MNIRRKLFLAGLVAALGLPAFAGADEPAPPGVRAKVERKAVNDEAGIEDQPSNEPDDESRPAARHGRWLGLQVGTIPPVLQRHLKLEHGVIAEQVLPDTPAAKAGLEEGDVLLAIDDKQIDDPEDVRNAVDSAEQGAELTISVLHHGEKTIVKVKPMDRPGMRGPSDRGSPMGPFRGADPRRQEAFQQAMQRLGRSLEGGQDMNMMFLRPGIVADPAAAALPKGTTIAVTRSGDEPAKVVVQRGDDRWEVTDSELDKLPEDLRGHVATMLGGPGPMFMEFAMPGQGPRPAVRVLPNGEVVGELHLNPMQRPLPPGASIRQPDRQNDAGMREVLEAIEQLNKKVEKLQEKLNQKP